MHPTQRTLERGVAEKPRVWRELPGDVLLPARFAQHQQGVRWHCQFRTRRSWLTAVVWSSHIRDRNSLYVAEKLETAETSHLSPRACDAELIELAARHPLWVSAFPTTESLRPTRRLVRLHGSKSQPSQRA
jgi:hypothetical protein